MGSSPSKQQAQCAESNSQQSAVSNPQQSAAGCGLCKTAMTITSKCFQCNILLCDNCRHQHLKEETNKGHRVNYIKDIGIEFETFIGKTFTTDLTSIEYIIQDQEDKLWIGCYDDGVLYQIQLQDQDFTIINKINMKVWDMARLSQNKILLSVLDDRLKLLDTETGEINDSVYEVSPFWTLKFNITKDNYIITGCYKKTEDDGLMFVVMILDKDGTRLAVYEKYQHNQLIFKKPSSLTMTSNGYIHVADNDEMGDKVIVLDRDGHVITRYTGNPLYNRVFIFSIAFLHTTPADRVIVGAEFAGMLHILDNTGQLVTYIFTEDKGILDLRSMALTDDGHILIGCFTYETRRNRKAKLHKLTISDI